MGTAYRRNWKNLTGKDDVTGYDVLSLGSGLGTAAFAATRWPDAFGVQAFQVPRAARLEGAVCQLAGVTGLTGTDKVGVELWGGGAVVASGELVAGSPAYLDLPLKKEDGEEITLNALDTVFVNVASDFGVTASGSLLSVRVHLALLE